MLDDVSPLTVGQTTTRSMNDLELRCKDGVIKTSSHLLAQNSDVFDRMLFPAATSQLMEEAKTMIVSLDDVAKDDMALIIQFCHPHENPANLVAQLLENSVVACIRISHRYQFLFALRYLCERLVQLIPSPSAEQIQFADLMALSSVVDKWSRNCVSLQFYTEFVQNLAKFPV